MNVAERFLEKKVHVTVPYPYGELDKVGVVKYIFHANLRPCSDYVLKYYFEGNLQKMREHRHLRIIMRPSRHERVVVLQKNGHYFIFPYNEKCFTMWEVDDE